MYDENKMPLTPDPAAPAPEQEPDEVVSWYVRPDEGQEITAQGDGFVRRVITRQPWCARSYQIGITCNFKSGKAFRKKSVEAGASEDKGRM